MSSTNHTISAGALVCHDDRLLLVRHVRPGRYDFRVPPGGQVEATESLEDAAQALNGQDRWVFTHKAERWWIEELHY